MNFKKDDNDHNGDNRPPPEPPPSNSKSTRKILLNKNIVDCRDQLSMRKDNHAYFRFNFVKFNYKNHSLL